MRYQNNSIDGYYHSIANNYRPQRSWGKVMFLHVSVILFTGVLSQHALQVVSQHALQQVLGGAIPACIAGGILACLAAGLRGVCSGGGLLPEVSAGGGCLEETPPGRLLLRAVRILLECILVFFSSSLFKVTCVRRQQQKFQPNVQMVSTSRPLGRFPVCSVLKDTSVQIKP